MRSLKYAHYTWLKVVRESKYALKLKITFNNQNRFEYVWCNYLEFIFKTHKNLFIISKYINMHLEAIIEGLRGGHGSVWFQKEVESESEPKFFIRFDLGVFKALIREKHN